MRSLGWLLLLVAGCRSGLLDLDGGQPPGDGPGRVDLAHRDQSSVDIVTGASIDLAQPDLAASLDQPCPEDFGTTLTGLRAQMVGSWSGLSTTPWTPSYQVKVTFTADGHYSAHSDGTAPAFYWGLDDDDPSKVYQVDNLLTNGDGMGALAVYFLPGDTTQGSLEHVRVCASGARLDYELWNTWSGPRIGPVVHRLLRN
jgi:hypothetical protein